jgi:hypothetical protein
MDSSRELKLVVYPGYGCARADGEIALRISGVVYEQRFPLDLRKQFLVKLLGRAMRATPAEIRDEVFRRRVAPFVAKPRRGLRVWLQIGPRRFRLRRRTRRSGWFRSKLILPADLVATLRASGDWVGDRIAMRAWLSSEDHVEAEGAAFVLPRRGVSIVSDIDDTIKESNVANRRELLANTFLREFEAIDGMPALYQEWAALGAAFHYVSSSPWQLFDPIQQWSTSRGFPHGTIHLRSFRLRDQVIRRKANAKRRKSQSISKLLKDFPERRFVLIGDSGERDPEIYARLCGKFADRIAAIFIRDLEDESMDGDRMRSAQAKALPVPCERFVSPSQLRMLASGVMTGGD